jgi:hypothetical protein
VSGGDGFHLDGALTDRAGAKPGKSDAGADNEDEGEPQRNGPPALGGAMGGFGD